MKKIKLAIADDCEEYRRALICLLHYKMDFEIIMEAENGVELLKELELQTPDIMRMPVMSGIEATGEISKRYPNQKVLAF